MTRVDQRRGDATGRGTSLKFDTTSLRYARIDMVDPDLVGNPVALVTCIWARPERTLGARQASILRRKGKLES